ncbi:MAG: hypothetical protein KGO50_18120 [Myxococcales bacterium]|nr:hypothetical protein [Myxococcales bacterium]
MIYLEHDEILSATVELRMEISLIPKRLRHYIPWFENFAFMSPGVAAHYIGEPVEALDEWVSDTKHWMEQFGPAFFVTNDESGAEHIWYTIEDLDDWLCENKPDWIPPDYWPRCVKRF